MIEKINSPPKAKPVVSSSKARVTTGERHALGAIVCCRVNCYNWDVINNSVEKTQRVLILCPGFFNSSCACSVDVSRSDASSKQIRCLTSLIKYYH